MEKIAMCRELSNMIRIMAPALTNEEVVEIGNVLIKAVERMEKENPVIEE